METCSDAGAGLRTWRKNDKDLLHLREGSLHFRRCLVQLRGLISSISSPLVRASSCAKKCPVISRFSTSAALLSAERRQAELKWAGRREMPAGFKLFMHFHHMDTQCHVGSEHCSSGSQLPLCLMPASDHALSSLQGEEKLLPKVMEGASREVISGALTHPSVSALCMCPGGCKLPRVRERSRQWGGEASRSGLSHPLHSARLPVFVASLVMGARSACGVSSASNYQLMHLTFLLRA